MFKIEKKIYIYKYTNVINNKVYIGQTINIRRRKREHVLDSSKKDKTKFHNAINKYGIENFLFEIICICFCDDEANKMEQYFISKYNSFCFGYNMTIGGNNYSGKLHPSYGKKHKEETKIMMSKNRKGKCLGVNNHNYSNKEYYETHSTNRNNFKLKCEREGWCFHNFKEVDSNTISSSGNKKYYYFYKGDSYVDDSFYYRDASRYEKFAVDRTHFLNVCKSNGWDFKQFKETHVATKIKSRAKLYTYKFIGKNNCDITIPYTDVISYYSIHDTFRSTFKRTCKKRNLNYNDFEENFSRWHYYENGKRVKKYFYKYKYNINE